MRRGKSNDVPRLLGLGGVLFLQPQPKSNAPQTQNNHNPIESRADGHENGLESPLNEFGDGGDDFLRVHVQYIRGNSADVVAAKVKHS